MYTFTINANESKIKAIIAILQAFEVEFEFEKEGLKPDERKKLLEAISWADNNPDKSISLSEIKKMGAKKFREFKLDNEKF